VVHHTLALIGGLKDAMSSHFVHEVVAAQHNLLAIVPDAAGIAGEGEAPLRHDTGKMLHEE